MSHKEYQALHKKLLKTMHDLTLKKQADYCGSKTDDPFYNVSRGERLGVYTTETGLLTRINDKMARIESFVDNGKFKVKDEAILDTCMDLSNYVLMLGIYLTKKK